jgi:hypothetical protein
MKLDRTAVRLGQKFRTKKSHRKPKTKFYIRGSVHRNSRLKKSNKMQQYADIYLLINYSTCFGRSSRPSSVHKTVSAASGTDPTVWGASFLKRDQIFIIIIIINIIIIWSHLRKLYLAINKYLHTVASRWISSTQNPKFPHNIFVTGRDI